MSEIFCLCKSFSSIQGVDLAGLVTLWPPPPKSTPEEKGEKNRGNRGDPPDLRGVVKGDVLNSCVW